MKLRPRVGNLVQFNSTCCYIEIEFKIGLIVAESGGVYKVLVGENIYYTVKEEFDVI